MKRIASTLAAALTSFILLAPITANASIIGLYHHWTGNDKISLLMKDGKPVIKIEYSKFPDLPDSQECAGFQTFPKKPPTGDLLIKEFGGQKGTGFQLWESRNCLNLISTMHQNNVQVPTKNLVQEIDLFDGFFGLYTNKDELIRGFQAGEFLLAVGFQVKSTMDSYESSMTEAIFTYQDAIDGKELLSTSR